MSNASQIEDIFVAHAKLITDVKNVMSYEPGEIDRKLCPLITMFFLLPEGEEAATGPEEDVDYRWEVSLYVTLDNFRAAQEQMRDLASHVIANFRVHRADYGAYYAKRLRRRNPPTPEPPDDATFLRASWELQVSAPESGDDVGP